MAARLCCLGQFAAASLSVMAAGMRVGSPRLLAHAAQQILPSTTSPNQSQRPARSGQGGGHQSDWGGNLREGTREDQREGGREGGREPEGKREHQAHKQQTVAVQCWASGMRSMQLQLPASSPEELAQPTAASEQQQLLHPRQFAASNLPVLSEDFISEETRKHVLQATTEIKEVMKEMGQVLDDHEASHLGNPAHYYELFAALVEVRRLQYQHFKQLLSAAAEGEGQGTGSQAFEQLKQKYDEAQEACEKGEKAWQRLLGIHAANLRVEKYLLESDEQYRRDCERIDQGEYPVYDDEYDQQYDEDDV